MGNSANWYAPPFAEGEHIAMCLGITLGLPWHMTDISQFKALRVPGARFEYSKIGSMFLCEVDLDNDNERSTFQATFHYEGFSPQSGLQFIPGSRLLSASSGPHFAAAISNLCDLFGGIVEYDAGWGNVDMIVSPYADYEQSDGHEFGAWHHAMSQIKVVDDAQVEAMRERTRYDW